MAKTKACAAMRGPFAFLRYWLQIAAVRAHGAAGAGGRGMGWKERPTADKFAFVGLAIGGCIGVFFAVEANFVMQFLVIAVGALIGFGVGRVIGTMVTRR